MGWRRKDIHRSAAWTGKLMLAVVLIVLIADSVQSRMILELFSQASPVLLIAALLLLPLNVLFQYNKWRLLVHSRFPSARAVDLSASLLLGFTFGIVTPARLGEFGGRAAGIPGADRLTLVGLTAVDKFATMLVTLLAGAAGLLLFCWRHPFMDPLLLTALLLSAAAGTALVLYTRLRGTTGTQPGVRPACTLPSQVPTSPSQPSAPQSAPADAATASAPAHGVLRRRIRELVSTLEGIDAARRRRLLLYSGLFYLTFLLQFFLLLAAFGPVDLLSAFAGISTIMLVKTVIPPITLGELGIREGASVYVLGHAGILAAAAFNASLLLFAINILLPSLVGLVVLLRLPPAGKLPMTTTSQESTTTTARTADSPSGNAATPEARA